MAPTSAPDVPRPAAPITAPVVTAAVTAVPAVDTATVARLMADLTELQELRDSQELQIVDLARALDVEQDARAREDAAKAAAEKERQDRRRSSYQERMEKMKEEEPERYAEIQKQREEFKERMTRNAAESTSFLLDVNTENMDEKQAETHEQILLALQENWRIMNEIEELSGEEASQARRQMHDNMHVLRDLYGTERQYLLEEAGRSLGYEGTDATEFAGHIQSIYDSTSTSFGRGRRPPR